MEGGIPRTTSLSQLLEAGGAPGAKPGNQIFTIRYRYRVRIGRSRRFYQTEKRHLIHYQTLQSTTLRKTSSLGGYW